MRRREALRRSEGIASSAIIDVRDERAASS